MNINVKNQLVIIFIILFANTLISQNKFEKGAFVSNSDEKVECFIKNIDWKNNPTEFTYRLSETGDAKTQNITKVKEFEVYGISKYIRATVNIDTSPIQLEYLTSNRNPVFKEKTLFLKFLVEGKANLYRYEDGNLVRFFYNANNNTIEQLVFKEYLVNGTVLIRENNYYRQQLLLNLKCEAIAKRDFEDLKYDAKELSSVFETYNICSGVTDVVNYEKKGKRDLFNFRAKVGLGLGSLETRNSSGSYGNVDFDSEIINRLGGEFEIILPFNNDKWALVIEPSYQSYKSEATSSNAGNTTAINNAKAEVNYTTIEIPVGLRHYFFINDDSKIFLNAFYSFILTNDAQLKYQSRATLDLVKTSGLSAGLGYSYKKLSLECRYEFTRDILIDYSRWTSNYNQVALIFGYQIF